MGLKVLSLFSGIGAFERGLDNLGINYELVGYSEFDKYASKSYSLIHNVSESLNLGDINKINEKDLPDFDLMTYGFPCQSFSVQGKKLGFDDPEKGNLFFESMRIVREKKPKYMIAENVKNLVGHDKGRTFQTILKTLEWLGYNNYFKVLNSIDFNTPQSRERVFIVSIRKDIDKGKFQFPNGNITTKKVKDILDMDGKRKGVKESLKPYMHERYFNQTYRSDSGIKKLFDGCAEGYFTSSFSSNRIFSIEGASPTLTTKNDAIYFEINGHLNQRERFALQGFLKEDADLLIKNNIPIGEIDKMSGNSITVNVIEEVQKVLLLSQEQTTFKRKVI
ncbi:DNA (cytosine-5-)-methyltransferase [Bacillus phage vB_BceH_LY2]|nr:DNA (cytosine-5-)-methyltransferase [Bacillus phage vB_BceH_LY2]